MRQFGLILLVILLTACANQSRVPSPTAPASGATGGTIAATNAPAPTSTSAPATPGVPLTGPLTVEPVQPPPTDATNPTHSPPVPLTPIPFGRTIQVAKPIMQGEDVSVVQRRLLALGYTQLGLVDGFFGAQSATAVRAFQKRNNLVVDGIVGPRTWERLFSTNPIVAESAGPLVPIVEAKNEWLLGASRDGRWVAALDASRLMAGGEKYTLYQPTGTVAIVTGTRPGTSGMPCEDTQLVTLNPNFTQGIAVGTGWNARPIPVAVGDRQDAQLLDIVAKLLKAHGITNPEVRLMQVLAADLNGDGITEQVVVAMRSKADYPSMGAAAGDYSLVAVIRKDHEPVVLIEDYYPQAIELSAPSVHRVLDLLDLNGDGTLEIVVSSSYFEGISTFVYAYTNGKAEKVIGVGCWE